MRNLDNSPWLDDAKLLFIEAKKDGREKQLNSNIRSFSLEVSQARPDPDKESGQ